jgi:hypothetical protein
MRMAVVMVFSACRGPDLHAARIIFQVLNEVDRAQVAQP